MTYKVSTGRSRKGVKVTLFDLRFKMTLFTALTKNGITDSQLLSKKKQDKAAIKPKLRRILNEHFCDKYLKDAKYGRLSLRRMTKVKYLVKGWKEAATERCDQTETFNCHGRGNLS